MYGTTQSVEETMRAVPVRRTKRMIPRGSLSLSSDLTERIKSLMHHGAMHCQSESLKR